MRLVHQPVEPAGAIEQRILGVQMKMDKVRVRHEMNLTSNHEDTKTQSSKQNHFCFAQNYFNGMGIVFIPDP
jgi:hypothetical protein